MMEFNDFLNKHKEEALQIDLKKREYGAYEILELKKMKLNTVTFDYEIEEVIAFCKEAIVSTKESLNRVILNKNYEHRYVYDNPYFLVLIKAYFEYLELYQKAIDKKQQSQQPEAVKPDEAKQQHPKFDPNLWNNDCFELFKYLYDCYYKSTNRQLTNIWFYIKESGNNKYILKATKDQYKDFILKNYQINITNFDKAQTKWEDKEWHTIDDHRIIFEDTLKQIAENVKNT